MMATEPQERNEHKVTLRVNEKPVTIHGPEATGAAIKATAIEQEVQIEPDYFLWEELADGGVRKVDDHEEVDISDHKRFAATPHEHHDRHEVTIAVNEMPVKLRGRSATGAEIKAAAIKQGVLIQSNFILQEELPNGTSRVVGDNDVVHLREHLRFTAIAPDDNS
jgi:Multiubiquitin